MLRVPFYRQIILVDVHSFLPRVARRLAGSLRPFEMAVMEQCPCACQSCASGAWIVEIPDFSYTYNAWQPVIRWKKNKGAITTIWNGGNGGSFAKKKMWIRHLHAKINSSEKTILACKIILLQPDTHSIQFNSKVL